MTAPLYGYGMFGVNTGLMLAVLLGVFFGFFLERGGLGDPHKLTGVFYLSDFTVPKVMLTAIIVAASGLYLLSDLKLIDMNKIWIVPTYFWPQIVGGAIFGAGFVLSGYCPGTAITGLATGRLDALVTMAGIAVGSLMFAVLYPYLEGFYVYSSLGRSTWQGLLGVNHWVVLAVLYAVAAVMFYMMERFENGG
ncbi:MAG: YeeE/YedE family protein [Nitrospirae bacterium]|nr:YeeE/YedE family protein [Nitrospirota bacterium]